MKLLAVTLAASLLAAAGLGGWILIGGEEASQASPAVTVGVDADPTGNTATSLGTIDPCISVSNGATFDVDIFITGVTELRVWSLAFDYDPSVVNIIDRNVHVFLAANPGSDVTDHSIDKPPDVSPRELAAGDVAEEAAAHESGSGVLARLTLEAVGPGVAAAMLEDPVFFGYPLQGINVDSIVNAWIAVDQSCPGEPPPTSTATPTPWPTPTITPSPTTTATPTPGTPTGTPTPMPSPTATPTPPSPTATPTPPSPSMAWTYSCYLGGSQSTEDALAPISGDVLAAYRLRPDQGYDRWFPGRPDVSTMTGLDPYDALFLLMMASYAAWPQEPWGESPTSVDLVFGWNSVCYAGQTKDAETATEGIADRFAIAYTLAPGQAWKRFVPGRPDISNLSQLESVTPVLVLVTEEGGALWLFGP